MAEPIKWRGQKNFLRRLDKLATLYPDATARSAAAIGIAVLHDAINEQPTVPYRTGKLRSSGTFEVFPARNWRSCGLTVGFNATYAARVHQLPWYGAHWTEPGSGSYFLSSKLLRHRKEYIRSWAEAVSRDLGMT